MQTLLFLAMAAVAVSAQPTGNANPYSILSDTPINGVWKKGPWRVQPGYSNGKQVVMVLYDSVKVAEQDMTFKQGTKDVQFYLGGNGKFTTTKSTQGKAELRFGEYSYTADLYLNGKWANPGFKMYERQKLEFKQFTPRNDLKPIILVLDSGDLDNTWYGDALNHGTHINKILREVTKDKATIYNDQITANGWNAIGDTENGYLSFHERVSELDGIKFSAQEVKGFNAKSDYWINASLSWLKKDAKLWRCMTQLAYEKNIRIIKSIGNSEEECDMFNPYVWTVGKSGVCKYEPDYAEETTTSYIKGLDGSSYATAKVTARLAMTMKPSELKRTGMDMPNHCAELKLTGKTLDEKWASLTSQGAGVEGKLMASNLSPPKRTFPGVIPSDQTF